MVSKTIQPSLDGLPDTKPSRSIKNRQTIVTRSGHVINIEDEAGNEHISFKHRTGAGIQFQPDGSVRLVSMNGKMGLEINGEGYINVTGAYYVNVQGSASFRIDEDVEWFVGGDMKLKVAGTFTTIAKDMAVAVADKYEMTAGKQTIGIAGDSKIAVAGSSKFLSDGAMTVKSLGGGLGIQSVAGMIILDPSGIDIN